MVIQPILQQFLNFIESCVFQQNNDCPQTAVVTHHTLHIVDMIPWPTRPPFYQSCTYGGHHWLTMPASSTISTVRSWPTNWNRHETPSHKLEFKFFFQNAFKFCLQKCIFAWKMLEFKFLAVTSVLNVPAFHIWNGFFRNYINLWSLVFNELNMLPRHM